MAGGREGSFLRAGVAGTYYPVHRIRFVVSEALGAPKRRPPARRPTREDERRRRAQATIAQELTAADVWHELSAREYGVLYALSDASRGLRITELCSDALLTQPGISRLIGRLETAWR